MVGAPGKRAAKRGHGSLDRRAGRANLRPSSRLDSGGAASGLCAARAPESPGRSGHRHDLLVRWGDLGGGAAAAAGADAGLPAGRRPGGAGGSQQISRGPGRGSGANRASASPEEILRSAPVDGRRRGADLFCGGIAVRASGFPDLSGAFPAPGRASGVRTRTGAGMGLVVPRKIQPGAGIGVAGTVSGGSRRFSGLAAAAVRSARRTVRLCALLSDHGSRTDSIRALHPAANAAAIRANGRGAGEFEREKMVVSGDASGAGPAVL